MSNIFSDIPVITGIDDVVAIEEIPLSDRNLPISTYEGIARTARAQPEEYAIRYIERGDRKTKLNRRYVM